MPRLALFLFVCFVSFVVQAAEPFLKPNDVIALVGGEDMVAASEYGYLELLLQRALPDHKLKVRSLAWEGDTVFEQPRDLNYPSLEAQLDEIGATVVIMQFGQMESLAGTSKLPEFIKAYEKLIKRVSGRGKRRVVMLTPPSTAGEPTASNQRDRFEYTLAIRSLARGREAQMKVIAADPGGLSEQMRDIIHLNGDGHAAQAFQQVGPRLNVLNPMLLRAPKSDDPILAAIRAKNRLWFHYYRPQNWAFLAGDRTEQPSSRDHKDPSKRWFPEEMKQWLPLIDAKEKEIWALAGKIANGGSTKDTKSTK